MTLPATASLADCTGRRSAQFVPHFGGWYQDLFFPPTTSATCMVAEFWCRPHLAFWCLGLTVLGLCWTEGAIGQTGSTPTAPKPYCGLYHYWQGQPATSSKSYFYVARTPQRINTTKVGRGTVVSNYGYDSATGLKGSIYCPARLAPLRSDGYP